MTKASEATRKWREEFKQRDPEGYALCRKDEAKKYYAKNKEKRNAAAFLWSKNNRARVNVNKRRRQQLRTREARASECLKHKYGITWEQKRELLAKQGGRCLICQTDAPPKVKNGQDGWTVDPCHEYENSTGLIKIRGILCVRCNSLLGMASDNVDVLLAAVKYLQNNQNVTGRWPVS